MYNFLLSCLLFSSKNEDTNRGTNNFFFSIAYIKMKLVITYMGHPKSYNELVILNSSTSKVHFFTLHSNTKIWIRNMTYKAKDLYKNRPWQVQCLAQKTREQTCRCLAMHLHCQTIGQAKCYMKKLHQKQHECRRWQEMQSLKSNPS